MSVARARLDQLDLSPRLGRREYEQRVAVGAAPAAATAPAPRRSARFRGDRARAARRPRGSRCRRQGRGDQAHRREPRPPPLHGQVLLARRPPTRSATTSCGGSTARSPGSAGCASSTAAGTGGSSSSVSRGMPPTEQWQRAFDEIVAFERTLVLEGLILVKFWLHISDEEQLARFEARQADPLKRWKLTDEDWRNRANNRATTLRPRSCSPAPTTTSRRGTSSPASRSDTGASPCSSASTNASKRGCDGGVSTCPTWHDAFALTTARQRTRHRLRGRRAVP